MLAPGFSATTDARASPAKIMYDESGRLGAFGSFFAFFFEEGAVFAFFAFFAAGPRRRSRRSSSPSELLPGLVRGLAAVRVALRTGGEILVLLRVRSAVPVLVHLRL